MNCNLVLQMWRTSFPWLRFCFFKSFVIHAEKNPILAEWWCTPHAYSASLFPPLKHLSLHRPQIVQEALRGSTDAWMTGCLDDSLVAQSVAPESKLKAEAFADIWSLQIENIPSTLLFVKQKLYVWIYYLLLTRTRRKVSLEEVEILYIYMDKGWSSKKTGVYTQFNQLLQVL